MSAPTPSPFPTDNPPAELCVLPQWVAWRYEERDGKRTKVPISPRTGSLASATDATTWTDFTTAAAYASTRTNVAGIGFVLAPDDPYLVIDLDGCRDAATGALSPEAHETVERFATYTEVSPSGTGVHLWLRGDLPGARNRAGKVEIYHRDRYMTVTGQRHAGTPADIAAHPTELADFYACLFPPASVPPASPSPRLGSASTSDIDDATLIERARSATNGAAFTRLWDGDSSAYDQDESRGDLALCGMLAFWTGGNTARIDRLFRQSGRHREKWERSDYRDRTITKALEGRTEFYDGPTGRPAPIINLAEYRPDAHENETPIRRGGSRMRTDYGNAERLVDNHGSDIHWVYERGMWATWDGAHWQLDETGEVERRAKGVVRNIYREARVAEDSDERAALGRHAAGSEAAARLRAMIDLARSEGGITVHTADFDRDPWLLNCQNCVIDLRTGDQRNHDRAELHMKMVSAPYDAAATCPTWLAFLSRIMGGNEQVITFLQRAVGYSLTGLTREQIFFLLYGVGANGKSTFLETLAALLAEYAQQAAMGTFIKKQHDDNIPNDVARMVGARFISAVEADEGVRLSESLIKQLTGGDRMTARFLHREFFDFTPEFKLWFSVNHRPTIRGTDHAIWRRPVLIPFEVVIPDDEQDKELKGKLRAELPGILAWAVQGCLDWQRVGLAVPQAVRAATDNYRVEMDVFAGFLEDRCTLAKNAWVSSSDLYHAYREWSEEAGERYETEQVFGKRLTERGLTRGKRSGKRCWFGITLVDNAVQGEMDTMDTMDTVSPVLPTRNNMEKNPGNCVHSVQSVQPVTSLSSTSEQKTESQQEMDTMDTMDTVSPVSPQPVVSPPETATETPGTTGEEVPPTDEEVLWRWAGDVHGGRATDWPESVRVAAQRTGFVFDSFKTAAENAGLLAAYLDKREGGGQV